jgi:nucleoside-diphosphate-sugar epimerase
VRVLVTGGTGFIGGHLCEALVRGGHSVRAALRREHALTPPAIEPVVVGDIATPTDWTVALQGIECVVHVAARAHVLKEDPGHEQIVMETNFGGTQRLAEAAARAEVRRFVLLSSVKVNGEQSGERPYGPRDEARPADAYARSKWLAEQALREASVRTGMEGVIVRAPLVYGAGVGANFLRLMRWVDQERPLPLADLTNRRSLVNVWNLSNLLTIVIEHPAARGNTWMVSDGEDVSTPDLVRRIARAMGRRPRLIAVPVPLLRLAGALTGRRAEVARLCDSLAVDITSTRSELGWSPCVTVDEALGRTARWYLTTQPGRDA